MVMVRYADDTFLGFEHREEAECFLAELRERVAQFGLSQHPEKTRLIAFGRYANAWSRRQGRRRAETFDFLGYVFSPLMWSRTLRSPPERRGACVERNIIFSR